MNINRHLGILYSRSRSFNNRQRQELVRGGVVREEVYRSLRPRIMFILKDPGKSKGWSWPKEIRQQVKNIRSGKSFVGDWAKTARPLGIWSYAIHHGFPKYNQISEKNSNVAEGLECIGMTNLKKTPGKTAYSIKDEVIKEAQRTSDILRKELEIMEPDIIICCGRNWVYEIVINRILRFSRGNTHITVSGKKFFCSISRLNRKNVLVLDFYHPAYRQKEMMYKNLAKVFNQLTQKGLV